MSRSMLARLLRLEEARTPDVGPVRAIVIRTATEADGRLRLSQLRASGEAPTGSCNRSDGLSGRRGGFMRSSIDQRLKKLEGTRYSGPRILFSAFPLPDDPVERDAYVDGLLASGEATLKNGMLNARPLTVEEWMAQVVAAGLTARKA